MCGATAEQKSMQAKQAAFYDVMTKNYNEAFGKHAAILDAMTAVLKPIVDKGPNQRGFSAEERTALDTKATESTAQNFSHAREAMANSIASRGGSDFIPSGVDLQIGEDLAAVGAQQKTALDNQIELADWDTGRKQWSAATAALGGVASEFNPTGISNSANNAGEAAATTANQIAAASNSIWGSVIGGLSGIAGAAVGGWTGGKAGKKSGGD